MIIWIASYPRSGNTFFRILLNQIYGIETYSIYDDPLFDKLKGSSDVIGHKKLEENYEVMSTSKKLFFVKTHNLPSDNYPAIYLVRDGRDSLVSYAHYLISFSNYSVQPVWQKKIKTFFGWNEHAEVLKNLIVSKEKKYGSWSKHVQKWNQREGITIPIKFEDLTEKPYEQVTTAIKKLNIQQQISIKSNRLSSFEELNAKWPDFFRQGKTGGWHREMSKPLQDLFWQYNKEAMELFGYKR